MRKRSEIIAVIYAVIIMAEYLLFFLIPFPKGAVAYSELVFNVIALCGGYGISWYALKKDNIKSRVYGFPIFKVGCLYTVIQLIVGWAFTLISFIVEIPLFVPIVISGIVLLAALLGVVGTGACREVIEAQETQTEKSIERMKNFRLAIRTITENCSNEELKKHLEKLNDDFRYSDPVTSEKLTNIENQLQQEINVLGMLTNESSELALKKVEEISELLKTRNLKCKELKRF